MALGLGNMASSSLEMQVPTHTSAHLRRAVDHGGMLSMTASGEYVTYPRDARLIAAAEEIALCTGLFFQSLFIAASDKYVGDRRKDADAEYLNTHPYDGSLEWVQRVFTTDRDFRRSHKGHPLEYFNSIFCLDPKDCYFWYAAFPVRASAGAPSSSCRLGTNAWRALAQNLSFLDAVFLPMLASSPYAEAKWDAGVNGMRKQSLSGASPFACLVFPSFSLS